MCRSTPRLSRPGLAQDRAGVGTLVLLGVRGSIALLRGVFCACSDVPLGCTLPASSGHMRLILAALAALLCASATAAGLRGVAGAGEPAGRAALPHAAAACCSFVDALGSVSSPATPWSWLAVCLCALLQGRGAVQRSARRARRGIWSCQPRKRASLSQHERRLCLLWPGQTAAPSGVASQTSPRLLACLLARPSVGTKRRSSVARS